MPASKKRSQRGLRPTSAQAIPAVLRDWVHIWHGVRVQHAPQDPSGGGTRIFDAKRCKMEELSLRQQFVRMPTTSLFPRVETLSNPRRRYKDGLYVLLNMRWPMLMLVLLIVFIANIVPFAVLLYVGCGDPDSLLKAFNLSYQSFTTIGFGVLFPRTTCSNAVVTIESFASMLVMAAITGLVFAKFAKPRAKVAFSNVCVIQPYGAKYLALVVRVANATRSKDVTRDVIMEANFKLNLLRIERQRASVPSIPQTPLSQYSKAKPREDQRDDVLCSYNLDLLQENFITFRMGIAVVHVIDESSPLYGMTEYDLRTSDFVLEVTMTGVDSTLQDTVSERYTYSVDDVRWACRFAELLAFNERNAEVVMDFAQLSAVVRAPISEAQYIRPVNASEEGGEEDAGTLAPTVPTAPKATSARQGEDPDAVYIEVAGIGSRQPQNMLGAIDELSLGATDNERMRGRDRWQGISPSNGRTQGIGQAPSRGAPRKRSGPPPKFSELSLEPLYEPLLQPSVGTQRLQFKATEGTSAFRRGARIPSAPAPPLPSEGGCGGEYMPSRQEKKHLQEQLAGEVDEHDEHSNQNDESEGDGSGNDQDGSVQDDDTATRPHRHRRSSMTNQSAVSIDLQDTPRFLKIAPVNIPKSFDFMGLYKSALFVRWPRIILIFVVVFITLNMAFGFIYWLDMSSLLTNPEVSAPQFELAFYMSVQTLATIGFGSIAPSSTSVYMNFWVFVESALGIMIVTIATGIAWAKFARPRAHIHFSSRMAITYIHGHRCLVFRAANTRHSGDVHENFFRIGVILTNRKTGLRQVYDVPLVTAEWPSIKVPATLIHIIDASSPFHKFESVEALSESRVAVVVLMTGLDTTFSESVYARKMYFWDDIAWNHRFADFAVVTRDRVMVDFNQFEEVQPDWDYMAPTPSGSEC